MPPNFWLCPRTWVLRTPAHHCAGLERGALRGGGTSPGHVHRGDVELHPLEPQHHEEALAEGAVADVLSIQTSLRGEQGAPSGWPGSNPSRRSKIKPGGGRGGGGAGGGGRIDSGWDRKGGSAWPGGQAGEGKCSHVCQEKRSLFSSAASCALRASRGRARLPQQEAQAWSTSQGGEGAGGAPPGGFQPHPCPRRRGCKQGGRGCFRS